MTKRIDRRTYESNYKAELVSFHEDFKKGYKFYNFRRPDKFSKEHLRGLQDIHREFSRQFGLLLTSYLRMHIDIDVVSTDQLTYDEFTRSMPSAMTIGIVEIEPMPSQIMLGLSYEVLSCMIDRMLGGSGGCIEKYKEITEVEQFLIKQIVEKAVMTLAGSWSHLLPTKGKMIGLADDYSTIQVATSGEIVALVTFEIQIASKYYGLMSLCYPYPVLEDFLSNLSSQRIYHAKGMIATKDESENMLDRLNMTTLKLSAQLGQTDISTQELLDLKIGDVIRLDNKITDDLILKVNRENKFFCSVGMVKKKVAVKVKSVYNPVEDILKDYI